MYSFRIVVFCLLIALPLSMRGQGTGNSPFSQFGVGDLVNNYGSVRNMGMGSVGVSARHHHYVNLLNPALLPNLRNTKTTKANHKNKISDYSRNLAFDTTVKIDFALTYQNRSIQSSGGYENASGINVSYLTFALPITNSWGAAIGIQPYSTANYNLSYAQTVANRPANSATQTNTGKGGIYKMFLSNGVSVNHYLSLGLESAFIFGNINNDLFSNVPDITTKDYGFQRRTTYSGFSFKPGINIRREIFKSSRDTSYIADSTGAKTIPVYSKKLKSSGLFYNIGFTYDFFTTTHINRTLNLYVIGSDNRIATDTTIESNKYKTQMPSTFRLGVSLDAPLKWTNQTLDVPLRWTVAADVFYSPWANYKPAFSSDTLGNSYGFSVGGEYTFGSSVKAKTYRAGFSYIKTPVIYRGSQLDDVSFSVGGSIPFGKRKRDYQERYLVPVPPKINLALVFGQRGDVSSFGIKEQYIKVYLGILIQQKWFNRSKIY